MDPKGSSPLSRGILPEPQEGKFLVGIIPALAGNTVYDWTKDDLPRDHPRSRGEYKRLTFLVYQEWGSSPLSRGIPPHEGILSPTHRIIPALAGNTRCVGVRPEGPGDHPRSRGEYNTPCGASTSSPGSSPLSRGILWEVATQPLRARIIPALAGNTGQTEQYDTGYRDHPRSRGEYSANK